MNNRLRKVIILIAFSALLLLSIAGVVAADGPNDAYYCPGCGYDHQNLDGYYYGSHSSHFSSHHSGYYTPNSAYQNPGGGYYNPGVTYNPSYSYQHLGGRSARGTHHGR